MALVPFPNKAAKTANDDEPDWDDHELEDTTGGKMSFLDHLDELRRRIIYSLIAVGVGFGVAFFWLDDIFTFIFKPMQAVLPAGQMMIYTEPGEQFFLMFKIGLMAGLIIASADAARVESLLNSYAERFVRDFLAVMPPRQSSAEM